MKVRVTKDGVCLYEADLAGLVGLLLQHRYGDAAKPPYEITVTLSDGREETRRIEPE